MDHLDGGFPIPHIEGDAVAGFSEGAAQHQPAQSETLAGFELERCSRASVGVR